MKGDGLQHMRGTRDVGEEDHVGDQRQAFPDFAMNPHLRSHPILADRSHTGCMHAAGGERMLYACVRIERIDRRTREGER